MKTLKRISALLLALLLAASFSITALAEGDVSNDYNTGDVSNTGGSDSGTEGTKAGDTGTTVDDNTDSSVPPKVVVAEGTTMNKNEGNILNNNGTINTNNGQIGYFDNNDSGNYGTVNENSDTGAVEYNQAKGTVITNNGEIEHNSGTVGQTDDNGNPVVGTGNNSKIGGNGNIVVSNNATGYIQTNGSKGTVLYNDGNVYSNFGTVENNNPDGYVRNTESGTVTNNSGTVRCGTVTNNEPEGTVIGSSGTVENNFAGTVTPDPGYSITVNNQYNYNAELTLENAEVPEDAVSGDVALHNGVYWVEDSSTGGNGGSITVNPASGHTLDTSSVSVESGSSEGLTVSANNGSLLLTLQNIVSNIKIKITGIKKTDPVNPNPPAPKPQATSPMFAASCKLTFDFDGGVLDGETELEMKCSAGQWIKLPEAPEKEGSTFAGWQTEVRGKPVVYEPGARYKVSVGKTFTALWIEDQA